MVLSPHQSYNTPESLERMLDVVVANIEHYLSGTPPTSSPPPRNYLQLAITCHSPNGRPTVMYPGRKLPLKTGAPLYNPECQWEEAF